MLLTGRSRRREEWQLGAREDWRFADMRERYGWMWPVLSFPLVYLSQHLLLVGICLPLYSIHFPTLSPLPASLAPVDLLGLRTLLSSAQATEAAVVTLPPGPPFDFVWDSLVACLALGGIVVAYVADTQLREYMVSNERLARQGKPKKILLNSGIWYYSRYEHMPSCVLSGLVPEPEPFVLLISGTPTTSASSCGGGRSLSFPSTWVRCVSLPCSCMLGSETNGYHGRAGQWYTMAGTFINSLCLAAVTLMVEKRMLDKPERRQAFIEYQRTTSALVPWFKASPTTAKKRN